VGSPVTGEKLARVEAAEAALHDLGLRQVRVRHLGGLARVEVGEGQLVQAQTLEDEILEAVRQAGFSQVELRAYVPPAERVGRPAR
jgi:uncharacterized protein